MKVNSVILCWLINGIIDLLSGLQRNIVAVWLSFQVNLRFTFLICTTNRILKMIAFQLKIEPYRRDVTDNKSAEKSPSLNNFTGFLRSYRDEFFLNSTSLHHHHHHHRHHNSDLPTMASYFDVTDNKTTDTNSSLIFNKEPLSPTRRTIHENLCCEEERLKTFENRWPLTFMDKNVLAQTGMYYTGMNDNVKCYFCEVEIGRWEVTDHPVNEHMRWSPNCPLLRRRSTNNIPLDPESLDRVLPAPSYDVCGGTETLDIRPDAYAESSIGSAENSTPSSPFSSSGFVYPDHPEYAIESARLRSFAEWPRTMKQKPKELAEAGFFYTGIGDRVKCFSCGGGLKDWDESDDPWEQHALWLSNCKYMKLMKGKAYVDSIIAKYKSPAIKHDNGDQTEEQVPGEKKEFVENVNVETNPIVATAAALYETSSEAKKITEEKLCKICYADEYNTAFLPCGHVVACAKCASSVTKCPMCRKPFKDIMRVYFS